MSESIIQNAYDFSFVTTDGDELPLSKFSGKTIVIVNIASYGVCSKQLTDLQKISTIYKNLIVIGVLSDDFCSIKEDTNKLAENIIRSKYVVDFIIVAKEPITGKYAHPFYKWAIDVLGDIAKPRWNFHKYVISPSGEIIDFFIPFTNPLSKRFIQTIEQNL